MAQLFEQLDDLFYQESKPGFLSYPVVPLLQNNKRPPKNASRLKRKSSIADEVVSSQHQINCKTLPLHLSGDKEQSETSNSKSNIIEAEDSDSGDEVVFELLSQSNKLSENTNKLKSTNSFMLKQSRRAQKKLSTIVEQMPNASTNMVGHSTDNSNEFLIDNGLIGMDQDKSTASPTDKSSEFVSSVENKLIDSKELQSPKEDHSILSPGALQMDDCSLKGGIYSMGFSVNSSGQVTSPLLLPTPATPPGVPLQPTPLMKEESKLWGRRYSYLRQVANNCVEAIYS